MTLKKITDSVFKILQVESGDRATLLPFLLQSLNEVRKEAEGKHDFQLSESFGYLTVPVGGAPWLTLKPSFVSGAPSGTDFSVKNMLHTQIYDATAATWGSAIQRTAQNVLSARATADYEGGDEGVEGVYGVYRSRVLVIRTGANLEVDGATETKKLKILCQKWLADYEDADSTTENPDFFIQHCHAYLKWATVLSMNKYEQTFVNRAEGNLSEASIRTALDSAWTAVELWDGMMHTGTDGGILE